MPEQLTAEQKLEQLVTMKAAAALGGGVKRIEAQHARGKLTARERIELLLDAGSFDELDTLMRPRGASVSGDPPAGEAVVTGWGKVDGRPVYVFSFDFTMLGGSLSEAVAEKILKVMDLGMMTGAPIIGIQDSGGARIQDGPESLRGFGEIFTMNTLASGVVPQISVIMGPCAGGAVYSPAITDFIFMTEGTGQMYITGPDVIRAVTGEEVTHEELGGADAHATRSGVAHFAIAGEEETLAEVRRLLSFLPSNNTEDPPYTPSGDDIERTEEDLLTIVPAEPNRPYDVREVIFRIVDDGDFMEIHELYAQNVVVGFARMGGKPVGIVANQPMHMAGSLDIAASRKAARFIRTC
ncbi:MAG TPA: carboxyl transferase domain-containing protein, partial [Tepidiformaceae bacterium]|nr:carboxyl transferase domain-containing protein [Tepidiformaceae bacterium]